MRSAWGSGKPLVSEHKIYVVRKESSEKKKKDEDASCIQIQKRSLPARPKLIST